MTDGLPEPDVVKGLVKSIPPEAWIRLVDTACTIFEKIVSPITESTSGMGRWLKARFDRLTETEKILAASALEKAVRKIRAQQLSCVPIENPRTLVEAVEGASKETSPDLHELWANLLAQEMSGGTIHPEIPRILSRITTEDAKLLSKIYDSTKNIEHSAHRRLGTRPLIEFGDISTVNHGVLESQNLIYFENEIWHITVLGREFIEAVSSSNQESKNERLNR